MDEASRSRRRGFQGEIKPASEDASQVGKVGSPPLVAVATRFGLTEKCRLGFGPFRFRHCGLDERRVLLK
jgi:hypothetical protein